MQSVASYSPTEIGLYITVITQVFAEDAAFAMTF